MEDSMLIFALEAWGAAGEWLDCLLMIGGWRLSRITLWVEQADPKLWLHDPQLPLERTKPGEQGEVAGVGCDHLNAIACGAGCGAVPSEPARY